MTCHGNQWVLSLASFCRDLLDYILMGLGESHVRKGALVFCGPPGAWTVPSPSDKTDTTDRTSVAVGCGGRRLSVLSGLGCLAYATV